MRSYWLILLSFSIAAAAEPEGAAIYQKHCALCHERFERDARAGPVALRRMSAEK